MVAKTELGARLYLRINELRTWHGDCSLSCRDQQDECSRNPGCSSQKLSQFFLYPYPLNNPLFPSQPGSLSPLRALRIRRFPNRKGTVLLSTIRHMSDTKGVCKKFSSRSAS